ncbi:DNA-directed RNA polymerase subunit beta [Candidatus Uhrbacteria bacterium]|nr:DNA-directed RNA polymerase subunit beta [Candidatus Uhrbacteria bacterium]
MHISKRGRTFFTQGKSVVELPHLVEIQKDSYKWFIDIGLRELLEEVSPIRDFTGRDLELSFFDYYFDEPKFDEKTSLAKNLTYESALWVRSRLLNKRTNEVKEQDIYLGDFPLMTDRGTFIVNGVERVVVSQLVRSAGVFFTSEMKRGTEKRLYGAKIIPNRGAWLEFETDENDVIWVKIDRKRKVAITSLLRAFGYGSNEEITSLFEAVDTHPDARYIESTFEKDVAVDEAGGFVEIYKRIRPGDMATADNARSLIHDMFFRFDRYDFGRVGRHKMNQRFGLTFSTKTKEGRVLHREDVTAIISEIIRSNISQQEPDDIDHLGNRRIRAVGELIQNKFRIGLVRMERIIKDRMSTLDVDTLTPTKLINARPVIIAVKEFFMSSQLSQFMDQTNPLSELEHKRRISALGPGGLNRERAGFEVRDVHPTHYGRICPIATPEGPNIGLVGHLASYARINEFGFLETPFKKIVKKVNNNPSETIGMTVREDVVAPDTKKVITPKGTVIDEVLAKKLSQITGIEKISIAPRVSDTVEYLDAFIEEQNTTTAATTPITDTGSFVNEKAEVRKCGQPSFEHVENIDYMDVASNQIVSVSTSLIPFLEHDDAARALMGSNMQRQAVPLVRPQSPLVGTGIEERIAYDSGRLTVSDVDGVAIGVEADQITVQDAKGGLYEYPLTKFLRSNASTCINQKPVISKGIAIQKGDVLADGPATENGELALGQNITVAFLSWELGNFEDAILISERLVHDDRFTSIHIENYQLPVRDTKLGPEVVTCDIPNVSEEKLKDLDEDGIVRIGAEVKSGDILVGKITPKGETELSPEEKLLRAIFGEKAKDIRDSSLYLEHGEHGKVIDIKIFSRENGDKMQSGVIKNIQVTIAHLRKIQVGDKMAGRHGNKGVISRVVPMEDMPFLKDGTPVDIVLSPLGIISRMNLGQILETHLGIAAQKLNIKVATPALDGITESVIKKNLIQAEYAPDGKHQLYDGRTGNPFQERTVVGVMYMMKLIHMVEDKIHQRSIGPYSLITQQPLGGKAQFGGQRFGEMEVWALEAYGAAHTLQEILTIKSDDVTGRSKAYEAIIKGERIMKLNVPEAFNVLVRELKGLALDVDIVKDRREQEHESYNA